MKEYFVGSVGYKDNENGSLYVYCPYSAQFVKQLKATISGATWSRENGFWIIKKEYEEAVKNLLNKIFGFQIGASAKDITIKAKKDIYASRGSVYFNSIPIVRAFNRDSGAKVCENVCMLDGEIGSGGSRNNWETFIEEGSIFKVFNVPEGLIKESLNWEIVQEKNENNEKENLLAEKKKLLEQIEQIDNALKAIDKE